MAKGHCKQSLHEFEKTIAEYEESENEEEKDKLQKLTEEFPRNIQDPVLSRWGTLLATCKVFIKHYAIIYFFAVAVKQNCKADSWLWKLCCALLSLMKNKSEEPSNSGQSIEQFVESFTSETVGDAHDEGALIMKEGDSPIFLTMLYFLNGFDTFFYHDHFNFLLKNDPDSGLERLARLLASVPSGVM